jgi:hypothetical protein
MGVPGQATWNCLQECTQVLLWVARLRVQRHSSSLEEAMKVIWRPHHGPWAPVEVHHCSLPWLRPRRQRISLSQEPDCPFLQQAPQLQI